MGRGRGVSDHNNETSINQQEVTMGSRKMLMTTAMVALLALPLVACSSTAKIRSSRLCTAAGGTYSGNTCNPGTPNQKSAKQMCDAHGGVYDSVLDMCEMPGDK
jgi:ABC-type oligopeptide transport system substrate-binding subunit